jgi:hypothetical protein
MIDIIIFKDFILVIQYINKIKIYKFYNISIVCNS